jgi:RND superfamily putative drug exporter
MFGRIADLTWRHPKAVLLAIGVFTVVAFALGGGVEKRLKAAGFSDPASDSKRAQTMLIERAGYAAEPWIVVLVTPKSGTAPLPLGSPRLRREVGGLATRLRSIDGVGHVDNPLDGGSPQLIAPSRRSLLLSGFFSTTDEDVGAAAAEQAGERLTAPNLSVTVGGGAASFNEVNDTVRSDLVRAELIAFPLLALLLLIVFRGVVAASIPLLVGMVSVGGTFLVLRVMSEFVDTSVFALNISTAMGLGLAVDYGLLLVSRYREELERDGPTEAAHRRLVETAGRTIVFSGLTVASAMAALTVLPQRFLYSTGAGGAIVSIFAAFGALLLVPSLLALLGERVNALSLRRGAAVSDESGGWYRLARGVMRRPVGVALASAALLLALASPVLGVVLTTAGADSVPPGKPSRQVTAQVEDEYPPGVQLPISVTVDGPASDAQLRSLERRIAAIDGIATPSRFRRAAPNLEVADFGLAGGADGVLADRAQRAAREIRALKAPAPLLLAGYTAEFLDLKTSLGHNLPTVLGLIALTTLILLFLLTGSVVLPLKTLLMNLLTLAATLGVMVAAFQWGLLDWPTGYSGPAGMETSTLVLMFAVIFGLATDYAVLVLGRIKELHDAGLPNEEAVAVGIARTGRVISAAALCIAAVFLAFTTSSIFFMKEAGIGYAAAVLIDATIVRALLVPALMRLFGDWNWWAPAPLRRFQRRFGFSEAS